MAGTAHDLLQTYNNASLQQMVKTRGLTALGKGKDAQVAALAAVLFDPAAIARSLADLTPVERLVLDRLILAGGSLPTDLLRDQLERDGRIDPPPKPTSTYYGYYGQRERGSVRARGSRRFPDVMARLGALGLVFTAEPSHGSGTVVDVSEPGRRLFIPAEILQHLPQVPYPVETAPAPAAFQAADAATLVRDLYGLLSFAARQRIQLTARGGIVKRTIGLINQELRRQEEIAPIRVEEELSWLPFLRALAEELGLLVRSVGELVLDPRAEEFLRQPAAERRQRLFAAYQRTGRWNELYRIPDLDVEGKGSNLRTAPAGIVAARRRVLAEVAELPVGEWVALEHLIARLRRRAYEFLLPRRQSPYYYYSSSYGASRTPNPYPGYNDYELTFHVAGEAEGWNVVEAGFIRVVVGEALPTFGIVELGDEGKASIVRLTADGGRLLRGEPLAADEGRANVVVQPNFQIFAFEPTGEDVLFRLDQLANRVRAEQAIEYELTRESIYRAQRAGFDTAKAIAFLESVSTVGLPQNVRRTLEEWGGELERITLRRRAPLLQVAEAAALDALYADPALAPLLGRRLAPAVALVPSVNLRAVADLLLTGGRFPALTEGPDLPTAPAPAALTVCDDGAIAFRQRLPNVYHLAQLRPFVEEGDGAPRLTADSLRRGARTGLSADDILDTLQRLHAGPLSPEVAALVRRWAKDWGRGALFQASVLQVDQAGTLSDLLADPEVKTFLDPIPGAPTLALVHPDALERVRARLDARGMALEDRPLR